EAQIVSYEWGEYLKRARQGEHEIAMLGYTWDYPDPSQILTSGWSCDAAKTGNNRARWCNREYSDLLDKANSISDTAERTRLYRRMQELFQEDVGGLLFANAEAYTPVRKKVVVADSHGQAHNLLLDRLRPEIQVVRSHPRPLSMMQGVEVGSYEGCFLVGYHAGATNPGGILAHTFRSASLREVRLNGVSVPE